MLPVFLFQTRSYMYVKLQNCLRLIVFLGNFGLTQYDHEKQIWNFYSVNALYQKFNISELGKR